MLIRPTETVYDQEQDATFCRFTGADDGLTGYYHARGGVCWPGTIPTAGATFYSGYLALLAVNRTTWATYLMGLREFQTVATVAGEDMRAKFPGIGPWLADVRQAWNCSTYYWTGDQVEHYKWHAEVERDPMTQPKPDFVQMQWGGHETAVMQVLQFLNTRRLYLPPTERDLEAGSLRSRLALANQHLDTPSPDVWAIATALHGLTTAWPGRI